MVTAKDTHMQTHQLTLTHTHTYRINIRRHSNTHMQELSQHLIQLGNARGKAEVIITGVFNSSVTGGCSFSVSKEDVNKQAELFKSGNQLAHAGRPPLLTQPRQLLHHLRRRRKQWRGVMHQGANNGKPRRSFIVKKCEWIWD